MRNGRMSNQYMVSLQTDLNEDLEMLNEDYEGGFTDSLKTDSIINRIKHSKLNPGTIKKVILLEFNGLIRAPRSHNRKTYNTLISTGNIGLLDNEVTQKLEELIKQQDIQIRLIDGPIDVYLPLFITFNQDYTLDGYPFSEELQSIFYDQVDAIELLNDFNLLVELKMVISSRLMNRKRVLEKRTEELIELIDQHLE